MTKLLGLVRFPAVLALMMSVSACGYMFGDKGVFRDTAEDYQKSPETPVLQVPPGKDAEALHELYPIPPVRENVMMAGEFEVPRPTPLVAGAADEVVRIQKLGDDSWALVSMAPGQLWPQVRSFLAAAGIPTARIDARTGIMETGWVELEGQPKQSRFQFRIEQGVQRGTSELHTRQMYQAGTGESWPQQSDNLEQETEMLRAVAQYVANSADSTPVSMIADQAMSAAGKISLEESAQGYTYIHVGLPFNRAWASLAKALKDSTFEITDRDRSAGTFYVRFLGPDAEEEDGWFDWLLGGDEGHPLAGKNFIVTLKEQQEGGVDIRLTSQENDPNYDKRQEQGLLALIQGNIS